MTKTIIIFCEGMSMGGTETLNIRLLNWYKNNGFRAILLTLNEIKSMTILEDITSNYFEHYVYNADKKIFISKKLGSLKFVNTEKPLILTQFLPEFFQCFELFSNLNFRCNFRFSMYIVHPHSTFISKKIKFLGKKLMSLFLTKNMITFMDEVCMDNCIEFYKLSKNKYNFTIHRLPIFIDSNISNLNLVKNNIFNILTITRFEFPFKGYVLGLIDTFVELFKNDKKISLTIIGYGANKEEVDLKLKQIPANIKERISVLDQVAYSAIGDYINKCDLYVGMGTTILDAANKNKIVITAAAYQNYSNSTGFFHNNYKTVAEIFKSSKKYDQFYDLILEVFNTEETQFLELSKKSKNVLQSNYNIDVIAPQLYNHTKGYLNLFERITILLIIKINKYLNIVYKIFYK